jgi:perosamine synthetase
MDRETSIRESVVRERVDDMISVEQKVAKFFGRRHCLLTGRSVTAIYLTLKASYKQGDEVVMPSIICPEVVYAVKKSGMKPVFCDSLLEDFTMDPRSVEKVISDRTRAIMAVHLFGHSCKMDALVRVARRNGVDIIEDVAQAAGGTYGGRLLGSFGDAALLSFGTWKILDAGGGGAIITDDEALIEKARDLQSGLPERGRYLFGPQRVDGMKVLLALSRVWEEKAVRLKNARRYARILRATAPSITLPVIPKGSNIFRYSVLAPSESARERILRGLNQQGIYARKLYPTFDRSLPNSLTIADTILNFIVWPYLDDDYFDSFSETLSSLVSC